MDFLFGLTAYAEPAASAPADTTAAMISSFLPLILMILIFYFLLIRPQKKKEKQFREMLAALAVGDTVILTCGIEGRVITVKEDDITIETGADRNKMKIMRWAISQNNTANEKLEAERKAAKEAAEAEKQKKMEEAAENSKAKRKKSKKKDDTFDA